MALIPDEALARFADEPHHYYHIGEIIRPGSGSLGYSFSTADLARELKACREALRATLPYAFSKVPHPDALPRPFTWKQATSMALACLPEHSTEAAEEA